MADNVGTPEVTVESLQALVEQVQADLATEVADHESTKGNLANALNALTEASEVIDGQKDTIKGLETRIEKLQTSPASYPTIVVDKVTYEVQAKNFKYKGEDYTAAHLLKDKSLQKELVKKGVGFLVEQKEA